MKKFCKLFETEDLGQLLLMFDVNDEYKPSVQVHFVPEGLGVCVIGPVFEDTDEGWEQAETLFNSFTEKDAVELVTNAIESLKGLLQDE